MTNEAIKRYEESSGYGGVVQGFIVADGTAITKGTILKLTDPKTAIISTATNDPIAGIAARDKIASDGTTELSVYKKGVFEVVASGAITCGAPVISAASATQPNLVKQPTSLVASSGAAIMGYALETASDAESFLMRLDL